MKAQSRNKANPFVSADFSPPSSECSGPWGTEILVQLEAVLRNPSRRAVHNLRRSCRVGQALQDLLPHTEDPLFRACQEIFRRTLRTTRKIRNADVLRAFLKRKRINLKDRFSRKRGVGRLRRRLKQIWAPESREIFGSVCREISRQMEKDIPERLPGIDKEMDRVLQDLVTFYSLWSSGREQDFSPVHELRIHLKRIDGRDKILSGPKGRGGGLDETRKTDLHKILRLLGRMSDLLMMEETFPRLEGKKTERRRFQKKIREFRIRTDTRIVRFLGSRVPEASRPSAR